MKHPRRKRMDDVASRLAGSRSAPRRNVRKPDDFDVAFGQDSSERFLMRRVRRAFPRLSARKAKALAWGIHYGKQAMIKFVLGNKYNYDDVALQHKVLGAEDGIHHRLVGEEDGDVGQQ